MTGDAFPRPILVRMAFWLLLPMMLLLVGEHLAPLFGRLPEGLRDLFPNFQDIFEPKPVDVTGPLASATYAGLMVQLFCFMAPGLTSVIALLGSAIIAFFLLRAAGQQDGFDLGFMVLTASAWLLAWQGAVGLARLDLKSRLLVRLRALFLPLWFGLVLLVIWELVVRGLNVPPVILPPPSAIAVRLASSTGTLRVDFVQTFVKGALSGYAIGCAAAFATAIIADRFDFLRRGLLPVGNFVAALPIIGIAPILVMWFGFDWQSKAAVVVVMVFFPVLVNTVQGLSSSEAMQRDLMHTYAASYWQSLRKLRLPAAMPFIFNGLKIATTLALIGAIVAEFFGSPVKGMGFRISTEVGRLALDMVWAEIAVAALAGSAFYGLIALIERGVTFWHPSQRR